MTAQTAVNVHVKAAGALSPAEIEAWAALQGEHPDFANPLMGPYFSLAVGKVREDLNVAVYRRGGAPVAFLPFHRRPGGLARPVGAPFSDYHGLVSSRDFGLSGRQALAMAGIKAYRANALVDPFGLFDTAGFEEIEAFVIAPQGTGAEHLEALRAENPKRFKNFRRLEHRLEREVGPLRFVANDESHVAFEAVLTWKAEQFRRTGLQDVLRPDWVRTLMDNLFALQDTPMFGQLSTLYAGEHLVAGHFGPRQGGIFHPWIASVNPDFVAHSPGQTYLTQAIRVMPNEGITVYDLASGHEHYKRPFGPKIRMVRAGLLTAGGGLGLQALAPSPARKVLRRLDHIAATHPTFSGRAMGLAEAFLNAGKRLGGNAPSTDVGS